MDFTAHFASVPAGEILALAVTAEDAGWSAIAMPDSVFYPEQVSRDHPFTPGGGRHWPAETQYVDPHVAISAMAAVTSRVKFFEAVLKAPVRQPLLVAKTIGSMAAMFPGRIAMGVGTSWVPEEFEWLNEDWDTRGKRLDEVIEIVRGCLSGWAEFHGRYYQFDRLLMSPLPDGPVPIYVGGHALPALRRAATLGDGWVARQSTFEQLEGEIDRVKALRADSARAGKPFEIILVCADWPTLDDAHRYRDMGVTNLAPMFLKGHLQSLEAKRTEILRFGDEVMSRIAA